MWRLPLWSELWMFNVSAMQSNSRLTNRSLAITVSVFISVSIFTPKTPYLVNAVLTIQQMSIVVVVVRACVVFVNAISEQIPKKWFPANSVNVTIFHANFATANYVPETAFVRAVYVSVRMVGPVPHVTVKSLLKSVCRQTVVIYVQVTESVNAASASVTPQTQTV